MPDFHGFGQINSIPNKRTTLDTLSYEKKMTLSEGDFRPCYFEEVLPSDIFHLKDHFAIKNILTPYRPAIDDSYLDISYFFVPRRLLWKHWEAFIGADATPDAYTEPTDYQEPTITVAPYGSSKPNIEAGSVLNDLGLPVISGVAKSPEFSPFPVAAVASIWNEFYRDENLQDENPLPGIVYNLASGSKTDYDTNNGYVKWCQENGQNAFNCVNKYHDLFTNCLQKPQKGDPVTLPLGVKAPLFSEYSNGSKGNFLNTDFFVTNGTAVFGEDPIGIGTGPSAEIANGSTSRTWHSPADSSEAAGGSLRTWLGGDGNMVGYADLSNATSADINSLRLAFAAQAYLEALARGGSRYTELLTQMFGVSPSDARMQRPEFLGTIHYRITQTAVASTNGQRAESSGVISPTDGTGARATGSLGAYSAGGDSKNVFVKQFEEHGYVVGIASIRVQHTYGQGIPKVFAKKDRFDYFNKYFDRIGNVPVAKSEIFAGADGTFGFQEAWYENKFHWNEISGPIGPTGPADLKSWTYADVYDSAPSLDGTWILEDRSRLDQNLIYAEGVPQFVLDIFHEVKATRPFSVNSVPAGIGF